MLIAAPCPIIIAHYCCRVGFYQLLTECFAILTVGNSRPRLGLNNLQPPKWQQGSLAKKPIKILQTFFYKEDEMPILKSNSDNSLFIEHVEHSHPSVLSNYIHSVSYNSQTLSGVLIRWPKIVYLCTGSIFCLLPQPLHPWFNFSHGKLLEMQNHETLKIWLLDVVSDTHTDAGFFWGFLLLRGKQRF